MDVNIDEALTSLAPWVMAISSRGDTTTTTTRTTTTRISSVGGAPAMGAVTGAAAPEKAAAVAAALARAAELEGEAKRRGDADDLAGERAALGACLALRGECLHPLHRATYAARGLSLSAALLAGDARAALADCRGLVTFLEAALDQVPNHPLLALQYFTLADLEDATATAAEEEQQQQQQEQQEQQQEQQQRQQEQGQREKNQQEKQKSEVVEAGTDGFDLDDALDSSKSSKGSKDSTDSKGTSKSKSKSKSKASSSSKGSSSSIQSSESSASSKSGKVSAVASEADELRAAARRHLCRAHDMLEVTHGRDHSLCVTARASRLWVSSHEQPGN